MQHDPTTTKAEFFTSCHVYSGVVTTRGSRLADLLNNNTTNVVEMSEVTVQQPGNSLSTPMQCPRLELKKESILLARPVGGYEAPLKRIYCYTDKVRYSARVALPGYLICGIAHLPPRANPMFLLSQGGTLPSFVPLTKATVQCATSGTPPFESSVVIFCRWHIEALDLAPCPLPEQSLSQQATILNDAEAADLAKALESFQALRAAQSGQTAPAVSAKDGPETFTAPSTATHRSG